ncbi:MAG TPA: hypothetical protein VGM23_13625, partial [Armatimonadota bacterium]
MKTPSRTWLSLFSLACLAASTLVGAPPAGAVRAQAVIPATWAVVADDFESGTLANWSTGNLTDAAVAAGRGIDGTRGLVVPADKDSHTIYRTQVAKAVEGYLTFWLNPNGVSLPEPSPNYWPPGTSISVADVVNSSKWWPPLVSLYLRKPAGHGYQGFISYPKNEAGEFNYDTTHPFDL